MQYLKVHSSNNYNSPLSKHWDVTSLKRIRPRYGHRSASWSPSIKQLAVLKDGKDTDWRSFRWDAWFNTRSTGV